MKIAVHEDNTGYAPASERFHAYDESTYCGCPDCHCPVGTGPSKLAALQDLIEQMADIEADQASLAELDEQRELELESAIDPAEYDALLPDGSVCQWDERLRTVGAVAVLRQLGHMDDP